MVGVLGMSDSLISYLAVEEGLNERNVVAKVLSDPDGRARTDRLLKEAKQAVREQLDLHRPLVEALREFKRTYNERWLIERHGFRTPDAVRHQQLHRAALAA